MAGAAMRSVWLVIPALAACGLATREVSAPVIAATPDRQESAPVTRVVTLQGFEDGAAYWDVDITRAELGAPGTVKVIGPGPDNRAQVFAAKACSQEAGRFDPAVPAETRDIKGSANRVFVFAGACL